MGGRRWRLGARVKWALSGRNFPPSHLTCSFGVLRLSEGRSTQLLSLETHLPPSLARQSDVKVYMPVHFYPVPAPSILIQDTKAP